MTNTFRIWESKSDRKQAVELVEQARSDERAKTLKEVYEKAYKLDWSEDAFVIWLEAEIKEIK